MSERRSAIFAVERWRAAWREMGGGLAAFRGFALYVAVRLWATLVNGFPVSANLATARLLGRIWWTLAGKHRRRAMEHLRAALGGELTEGQLRRIAQASFLHWSQVYLVELALTQRLINLWSWARYVELGDLSEALRRLLAQRGAVMVTAHFGNFELLGYTIARLGLPIAALMRPLDNPLLNNWLLRSRETGGLELIFKKGATARADEVLRERETLCFIADQDAGKKQVFSDFFGRKASWYKSIGLLAMSHRVPVIVGSAVRTRRGFHYRIEVERIIDPEEWDASAEPLQFLTDSFAAALERAIRKHPEQYLWIHRRWKTRPRDEQPAESPAASPRAPARV